MAPFTSIFTAIESIRLPYIWYQNLSSGVDNVSRSIVGEIKVVLAAPLKDSVYKYFPLPEVWSPDGPV